MSFHLTAPLSLSGGSAAEAHTHTHTDTGTNALVSAVKAAAQQTTSNDAIITTGGWERDGKGH